MTNSADLDQLASEEANWSGSTLFANNSGSAGLELMANSEDQDQLPS